jgi:hypothetical protein
LSATSPVKGRFYDLRRIAAIRSRKGTACSGTPQLFLPCKSHCGSRPDLLRLAKVRTSSVVVYLEYAAA